MNDARTINGAALEFNLHGGKFEPREFAERCKNVGLSVILCQVREEEGVIIGRVKVEARRKQLCVELALKHALQDVTLSADAKLVVIQLDTCWLEPRHWGNGSPCGEVQYGRNETHRFISKFKRFSVAKRSDESYMGHIDGSPLQAHSASPDYARYGLVYQKVGGLLWQAVRKGKVVFSHPRYEACRIAAIATCIG